MKSCGLTNLILAMAILFLAGCDTTTRDMSFEISPAAVSKGPIQAKVSLARKEISILDTQYLKLEIEAPVEYALQFPSLAERLEDYRQVPWRFDEEEISQGRQKIKKYFAFELYESGEQMIPPFAIRYTSGTGDHMISGELATPKLAFNILPIDDPNLFKSDLKPAQGLLRPEPYPWLKVSLLAVLVLVLLYMAIVYLRKKLKRDTPFQTPVIPAHVLAYQQLQKLIERRKTENMPGEVFVAELSEVLRQYIERQFNIHAPEQTTEEFLAVLLQGKSSIHKHATVLKKFLEYTDLVKFATLKVADEDIQKGFDFIKDFIEKTRPIEDSAA